MANGPIDLSNLPPEVIQAVFGMGAAQQQEDETTAAIARTQALMDDQLPMAMMHTEPIGAALAGVGDMIKARRGGQAMKAGQAQLQKDRYNRDLAETRAMYRMYPPAPAPTGGDPNDPVLANQPPGYVGKPFGF